MLSHRWQAVAESQFPWEREALDYLRQHLPDVETTRAWANGEFISLDGRLYEADVIVITARGMFLVEIKSRPGEVFGDLQDWVWRDGAHEYRDRNPVTLTNAKAKRLSDLLKNTQALRAHRGRVPFIEPLVFLSAPGNRINLPGPLKLRVYGRDPGKGGPANEPGIIEALTNPAVGVSVRDTIDAATARMLAKAMEEIGLRPSVRVDQVGDYKLGDLLEDGPTWQDYEASHVSLKVRRRIRRYPVPKGVPAEQRQSVLAAARREFEILEGIRHEGIVSPQAYHETETGPALVFPLDTESVRLDRFLTSAEAEGRLDVHLRLHLLRATAEVLEYAHERRLFHRALNPQAILVTRPASPTPGIALANWFSGERHAGTTLGAAVAGTLHIDALLEDVGQLYVAPELRLDSPNEAAMDVFSLGAVAYHVFTGAPPADSLLALDEKLQQHGGLLITDRLNGAPPHLTSLIHDATRAVVSRRIASMDEFLECLEVAEAEANESRPLEPVEGIDPVEANKGDELPGGLTVKKRLGKGSTAVALLVERDEREYVLKVALAAEHNTRLRAEGEVLASLRHPNVVALHGEPLEVAGRTCLLIDKAGESTLAQRLREDGPLQLDFLQRFGEDLLTTLDHLEEVGVSHRDIKPDNLGVTPLGRGNRQHLVLFDFSLSREPAENIRSGTTPYLEPFLKLRRPQRWDIAAERFAAAVTLHEMATGQLPKWGDGLSDPALVADEVTVAGDLLDAGVRDQLTAFLRRALARDPAARFDNARDMLDAWRAVFASIDRPPIVEPARQVDPDTEAVRALFEQAVREAMPETPLATMHVSTRGLNALERVGCTTAGQLARLALTRVWALPGVGHKTRRELGTLAAALRERFATTTVVEPGGIEIGPAGGKVGPGTQVGPGVPPGRYDAGSTSVDALASLLLPKKKPGAKQESRAVPVWLGLDPQAPWGTAGLPSWPNQTDAGRAAGVTRARVSQAVLKARDRWRRDVPLTALRADLAEIVQKQSGAVTADELAALLLAVRGSQQEEPLRSIQAKAVVRAALDVEESEQAPRLVTRRIADVLLVAIDQATADWAERLGAQAREVARREPLASPESAMGALLDVPPPDAALLPPPARLLRLAALVSGGAAVSSRQELYPRGMEAARALRLTPGLLASRGDLTIAHLRDRVSSRYPEAEPLPGRPELDLLLREAGLDLEWVPEAEGGAGAYRAREAYRIPVPSVTSTLTRFVTRVGPPRAVPDEAVLEARAFEERLRKAADTGQFLVLTADPRGLLRARLELARFGVEVMDTDALIVSAMKQEALKAGASWDIVLRADAAPRDGADWRNLQLLVGRAMAAVTASLLMRSGTVLLTNPGLLARYERLGLFNDVHQQLGKPGALQGLWVLLPADGQSELPRLDGAAVPVIGRSQWARIPEPWLRNQHRAA
jgi:serine/threonine protein kinase